MAVEMRAQGAVPGAIAERLRVRVATVTKILREEGLPVPRYFADATEYADVVPELS
jgi:hypothetical protein